MFEEFTRDPLAAWRSVVAFLGLDAGYEPSFERVNAARQVRHRTVSRFLNAPPDRLRALARRAIPLPLRHRLYHEGVRRVLNDRIGTVAPPPAPDAVFVAQLRAEFVAEVADLGGVIGRPDLPGLWAEVAAGAAAGSDARTAVDEDDCRRSTGMRTRAPRVADHGHDTDARNAPGDPVAGLRRQPQRGAGHGAAAAAAGWNTTVVLPKEPGNAAARLRAAGLEVVEMPLHRLRASRDPSVAAGLLVATPLEVRRLAALMRERGIDLVRAVGIVHPQAALAARLAGRARSSGRRATSVRRPSCAGWRCRSRSGCPMR